MNSKLLDYYHTKPEPEKSCLLTLRTIILEQDSRIFETLKYGMPCFCYIKNVICYLWTDKKSGEPYILFVKGKLLDHPNLEAGNRSKMKIFRIDANEDIPKVELTSLLRKALALYQM